MEGIQVRQENEAVQNRIRDFRARGHTIIIQGAQYGSEGKGQVAAEMARIHKVKYAVRTGSINAGHTVYFNGDKFSMQIIPTAWIHKDVTLILGAGCYVEPTILRRECEMIREATGEDIRHRLYIDKRCVWFGADEANRSKLANRHHAMGATGKGCSEAVVSKLYDRGDDSRARARLFENCGEPYHFTDTVMILNNALEMGANVLLEGTQGSMLDLNTGPYPYVTSRMTSSPAWLAEAGLPPINVRTILVARSYPIRVAGNSGPMPHEISWPLLAEQTNRRLKQVDRPELVPSDALAHYNAELRRVMHEFFPQVEDDVGEMYVTQFHLWSEDQRITHRVALSEASSLAFRRLPQAVQDSLSFFEKTTVTKKLRRIAEFDVDTVRYAAAMNGPVEIVYSFLNYVYPELYYVSDKRLILDTAGIFLAKLEADIGVPITYVTTGPLQNHVMSLDLADES